MDRFRAFYEMYLGPLDETDDNGDVQIRSCFRRSDANPSMFVNLQDGRYNDFGSDYKGDAYNFYMAQHDVAFKAAKKAVDEIVGGESFSVKVAMPIPETLVDTWHVNLLNTPTFLKYAMESRGVSLEVIKKLKIGFDGDRFTFPVYNDYGLCVNVRRYSPMASGGDKMINYKEGYGLARLIPLYALKQDIIFLVEGEWDMGVMDSLEFNAATQTAGAGTWKAEWSDRFKGKTVYIVYDYDAAGLAGSLKVASAIYPVAKKVYVVQLPLEGTKDDKDISDYFVKHGNTAADFLALLAQIPPWEPSADTPIVKSSSKVNLADARSSKYKGKNVTFDVMVVGKDTAPYNVPYSFTVRCAMTGGNEKTCAGCAVGRAGGEQIVKFPHSPQILELIRSSKAQQTTLLKKRAGIPNSCATYQLEDEQSVNVEEILIAPEIEEYSSWSGESMRYLLQSAFFIGMDIDANRSYRMKGTMTPDPWQQHVTFVLTEAEPLQDSISAFVQTPENVEKLSVFQTDDVAAKFEEITADFEDNVTNIIGRADIIIGIDLVYHSVLSFNFQGITISRGWLETLIIGDTRTGKSETAQKMLRHYQLGEMSTAENTSYAGLVGGLQQTGDRRWMLTWGKLPLNDGRIFFIDEASGLSVDDIAKMSSIRSSGIAEVTKIQTEKTHSRTRLIWLSNPRSGRAMAAYSYGVQTVPELIGKAEDIARFDYVISASRSEVDNDRINSLTEDHPKARHTYTSELCKRLILWVWSRTPEQVVFEPEAIKAILDYAKKQGKEYAPSIPLIEGANQRIKLARMAVAVACRVFSTDETGELVIVKKEHADYAYQYFDRIYGKPSFDYKNYSRRELRDERVADESRTLVFDYLDLYPGIAELFDRQEYIWPKHFEEQLGNSRESASEHIMFFSQNRMIKDSSNRGYRKTPAFIALLREWKIKQDYEN